MPLVAPTQLIASAATDLAGFAASVEETNALAATRTTVVAAAGTDELSAAIAAFFANHARAYQAIGARLSGRQQQFVAALHTAGNTYAAAEAVAANPLQSLLDVLNAPSMARWH
ncbi:PE family protein [Mycobacterium camsae]|uniref:PE family protein n=1 Tax=Mycobacterium gordonae TaxID=1778 RepID=UPI0019813959|nr:PE family protein [Mycobacterium gordonae]